MLHTGDCVEVMAAMEPASVDAIVTDPPYGLEFMGKGWDRGVIGVPYWTEMLRLAKPGAYLLAFGGTRTYHRMTCAIEDAGWIIRDCLVWAYASGFPKSKALLKPAWEPIVMARKPGPLRELAIDACRIGTAEDKRAAGTRTYAAGKLAGGMDGDGDLQLAPHDGLGRWPANVVLTDPIFDGDTPGVVGGGDAGASGQVTRQIATSAFGGGGGDRDFPFYGDSGTYSRFFILPKAARSEREPILPSGLEERTVDARLGLVNGGPGEPGKGSKEGYEYRPAVRRNVHPTVKPLDLMRHLVRLVTPPGGTVLDPFLGSGTTGLAAEMEGFAWVGIEREAEYVAIAEARLNGTQRGLGI